jgi:hypothetical protein
MCARMGLEEIKGYRQADVSVIKSKGFVVRQTYVWVSADSTTCVTLGVLLKTWFLSKKRLSKSRMYFGELPWKLNNMIHVK